LQLKRGTSKDDVKEEEKCGFCSGTALANKDGEEEPLLTCKDCSSRGKGIFIVVKLLKTFIVQKDHFLLMDLLYFINLSPCHTEHF